MEDAGIFLYGFHNKTTKLPHDRIPASRPYVFYMMGAPQIATWMYQKFGDWDPINKPDQSIRLNFSHIFKNIFFLHYEIIQEKSIDITGFFSNEIYRRLIQPCTFDKLADYNEYICINDIYQ